jgi:3-dehydroquinate synthase
LTGESIRVPLGDRSYDVEVGRGLLKEWGARLHACGARGRVALVTSTPVDELHGETARRSIREAGLDPLALSVPDGEAAKTPAVAAELHERLLDAGAERGTWVLALGGGTVGDVAGYAAATFMRGVPFAPAPTTLLAQVDASVGGKTGVNLPRGKNLVGAFHQPELVLVDLATLDTLPGRQLAAGWAEVAKAALIADAELFRYLESSVDAVVERRPEAVSRLVASAIRIKAEVVGEDERDLNGRRALLNFGHTVGHALEGAAGYGTLLHGEAVAIGMSVASRIACELGFLSPEDETRSRSVLERLGLPVRLPAVSVDAVLERLKHDKKVREGRVRFVLTGPIGVASLHADVPHSLVRDALASLTSAGDGMTPSHGEPHP